MAQQAVRIAVRVTPKASRCEVAGITTDDSGREEVHVRVTAAPESGKANKAVCETIACALGIARGCVTVARGGASRHKLLEIEADQAAVDEWMAALARL